jgi:hypothetical protein
LAVSRPSEVVEWFSVSMRISTGQDWSSIQLAGSSTRRVRSSSSSTSSSRRGRSRDGADDMGVPVWCLALERNIQRTRSNCDQVAAVPQCRSGGSGLDQIRVLGGRFGRPTGLPGASGSSGTAAATVAPILGAGYHL